MSIRRAIAELRDFGFHVGVEDDRAAVCVVMADGKRIVIALGDSGKMEELGECFRVLGRAMKRGTP